MNTKSKAVQIVKFFIALRDKGFSVEDALARIAKDSNADRDTILKAIMYGVAA